MSGKDLTHYLKPENAPKPSGDLDIDLNALNFEVNEEALEARRSGGGEAIVPGADDNNCGSGGCIL